MAWLEDMVPWQYTDLLKEIKDAIDIPLLTGEDIYLKEPSRRCAGRTPWTSSILTWPPPAVAGDQEDRRYGPGLRRSHGDALRGDSDLFHGKRALRGGDREFPGAGTPFCRCALVGRPGSGRKAVVQ